MSTLRVNNMTDAGGTGSTYAKGHVVQVVNDSYNVEISTTSTSMVTTGLSATITPKFATSKIFIITNGTFSLPSSQRIDVQLFRNGSPLPSGFSLNIGSTTGLPNGVLTYLDSPNSTSALTYNLRFQITGGTAAAQWGGQRSSITLMEVAA